MYFNDWGSLTTHKHLTDKLEQFMWVPSAGAFTLKDEVMSMVT